MNHSVVDPCVLYQRTGAYMEGLVIMQVDDSLMAVSASFRLEDEEARRTFKTKPIQQLRDIPIVFNGVILKKEGQSMMMTQAENTAKLRIPECERSFASIRAMAEYMGVNLRPDIAAGVQFIAPGGHPTDKEEFATLKKFINHLKRRPMSDCATFQWACAV